VGPDRADSGAGYGHTANLDSARHGIDQAGQYPQDGGLAGPVRAYQQAALARLDPEIHD
jgi:hypothetical protein